MTDVADLDSSEDRGFRAKVQRFGGYLAGMVMPNMGAFIAWGLVTALFIPTGWLPNETLATLVDPMIKYLLPLLIGFTGGRIVHGPRGAVVGAVATMGVIVGTDAPMFLGAMIIGPLAASLVKGFDWLLDGRIRSGFEMLVNNFSAGIIGGAVALVGLVSFGPAVEALARVAGDGVDFLVAGGLLPLVSVLVEPAKVLFLNNAINHGVLSPIGVDQASETGKSLMFMIETNPGPGLGVLLAFLLFGPRRSRPTVPGAMIVQFLGGIHEIYFPYVLMKPQLLLAAIGGGMAGVATALVTHVGLVSTPSPGSIFAYLAVTPRGDHLGVLLSVAIAAGVAFVLGAVLLGFGRGTRTDDTDTFLPVAAGGSDGPQTRAPSTATAPAPTPAPTPAAASASVSGGHPTRRPVSSRPSRAIPARAVTRLLVACDAGMGSSVMLASKLRTRLRPLGVRVQHVSINEIPPATRLVLTHADLASRARAAAPRAVVVPFRSFVDDPAFDRIERALREGGVIRG